MKIRDYFFVIGLLISTGGILQGAILPAQAELVRPRLSAVEQNKLNKELFRAVEQEGREGMVARVQDLIARGADVTARDQSGWIPLHYVAYRERFPELIEVLIRANLGSVHYKTECGRTALHLAAFSFSGELGSVAVLLKAGASPNIQDNKGRTSLHRVFLGSKNEEIIKALVDAGANPDIPNNDDGKTPRQLARERKLEHLLAERGDTKPARAISLE